MPYKPEHKAETRTRIVRAARRLFNRHGYAGVSIDGIMAEAGLTRGGFYAHFSSKDELYAEAITLILKEHPIENWEGVEFDPAGCDVARQIVNAYLSNQHFDDIDGSCPMVTQPTDVARGGEPVKDAFTKVFETLVNGLTNDMKGRVADHQQRALAVATLCVGGMVIARAVDREDLSTRVREAARLAALQAGGWDAGEISPR